MVSYWSPITAINNVLTLTIEVTSHTESHTQCYSIKKKDVKNKEIKMLYGSSHPKHFLKVNVSQKKTQEKVKLGSTKFTKSKTPL